jgi:hypothetical protein
MKAIYRSSIAMFHNFSNYFHNDLDSYKQMFMLGPFIFNISYLVKCIEYLVLKTKNNRKGGERQEKKEKK